MGFLEGTGRARAVGVALGLLLVTLVGPAPAMALAPVVEFTYTPTTPRIGQAVAFASQSTDPALSSRAWDLDGDGAFDDGTGLAATATFVTPGPHTVSLRATDLAGVIAGEVSHVVNVNFPPEAALAYTPANPAVGQTVTFRSRSKDRDGRIAQTLWDLDDDGAFDDGSGNTAKLAFATTGDHTVNLLVRDDVGDEATVTARVSVVAPSPAPVAGKPPAGPAASTAGTALAFGSQGTAPTVPAPSPTTASPRAVLLGPFPIVHLRGTLLGDWVRVQLLTVRAPLGARVALRCSGVTCPFRSVVRNSRGTAVRFRMLEGRRLRVGVVLRIAVTKQGRIGKYTRFVLRRNAPPVRRDLCMAWGATRPSACPVQ